MQTTTRKSVETPKRSAKKQLVRAKQITKNSFEINKQLTEKEKSEINNIIAILLDDKLSMAERLKRAGRSPASSGIVRIFRKNMMRHIHNYEKKRSLEKSRKKYLTGILNLTTHDITLTSFLRSAVESSIDEAVKHNERGAGTMEHSSVNTKETGREKSSARRRSSHGLARNSVLKKSSKYKGKTGIKSTDKIVSKSKNTLFTSLKSINPRERVNFEKPFKLSQVEQLEISRRNQANSQVLNQDIGRTLASS